MIAPWGKVRENDEWMPKGFDELEEAQLGKAVRVLGQDHCAAIQSCWIFAGKPQTPNWDIASTCLIDGRKGVLLIEAKAHEEELHKERKGKTLKSDASANSRKNDEQIGNCIEEANVALREETRLPWQLSHRHCYQMANRFASAWKVTTMGYPVILVYLGFLGAGEMRRQGRPLAGAGEWERLVRAHCADRVPDAIWEREWKVSGQNFVPLIRSYEQTLDEPPE